MMESVQKTMSTPHDQKKSINPLKRWEHVQADTLASHATPSSSCWVLQYDHSLDPPQISGSGLVSPSQALVHLSWP